MRNTAFFLFFALIFGFAVGCGSIDNRCDRACAVWETECGYTDYTYDICFADCKADGDWGPIYVSCLEDANDCGDVELCDVL